MNVASHFSELSSTKFILQLFSLSMTTPHILPPPSIRAASKTRVQRILSSITLIQPLLLTKKEEHSSTFESRNIQTLGESLLPIDILRSAEEVFSHFAMLKSWMFCMELRSSADGNVYHELGAKVVRLHFYDFLEAMIPYFPPSCRARLEAVCGMK